MYIMKLNKYIYYYNNYAIITKPYYYYTNLN